MKDLHKPWRLTGRGALMLLSFGFLVSLVTSLLASDTPDAWPLVFGLHALFVQWVMLSLLVIWWAASRNGRALAFSTVLWLLLGLTPLLVLAYSLVIVEIEILALGADPFWWVIRNIIIGLVLGGLLAFYLALQWQWQSEQVAESASQLEALQARIAPHFLFNTLNTIADLIHENPAHAEQATVDLSELLRIGLRGSSLHSLGDELELVKGYLRIESLRLGERLKVSWDLPGDLPLDLPMPALLIQPLVENAIIHGISRRDEGGELKVSARPYRLKRLQFTIENPLPPEGNGQVGNRTALDNIRQRLSLAYEEGSSLKTERIDGHFRVTLILPLTAAGISAI